MATPDHDPVNSPSHYTRGGIETIDFIEAKELPYHLGNVIKYVARAGHKQDILEDLQKAEWYLRRYIGLLTKQADVETGVRDDPAVLPYYKGRVVTIVREGEDDFGVRYDNVDVTYTVKKDEVVWK